MSEQRSPAVAARLNGGPRRPGTTSPDVPRENLTQRATPTTEPATGTDTVTLACKHPNGLILQVHVWQERKVENNGQRWTEKVAMVDPGFDAITLNGSAINFGELAKGRTPQFLITPEGYALTPGIPRAFWERWIEESDNKRKYVDSRIVFCASNDTEARAQARDYTGVRTGLEPIDPAHPMRIGVRGIERGAPDAA